MTDKQYHKVIGCLVVIIILQLPFTVLALCGLLIALVQRGW